MLSRLQPFYRTFCCKIRPFGAILTVRLVLGATVVRGTSETFHPILLQLFMAVLRP